jgi:membrane protein
MVSLPDNPRELVREVIDGYARVDLLTYANAIAFQILFAVIPLLLCVLGVLGFLGLESFYDDEIVPALRDSTSDQVFRVLDETLRRVLGSGQGFWITIGAALTVWKMSGAMRAVMGVFERIYDGREQRGTRAKYVTSIWLAVAAGLLLLAAPVVTKLLPLWLGWPAAIVLMFATVALVVHFAPNSRPAWRFVSLGTVIVVVAWALTSAAFGLYVTDIADYGTVFGNLATVIITFEYVYLAATAFLTGALLDAIVRDTSGVTAHAAAG